MVSDAPPYAPSELKARVSDLAEAIDGILRLTPIEAARSAPRLIDDTKAVMSAVRKAAIAKAAAGGMTQGEIAAELGVSVSAVNQALVEHRASTTVVDIKPGGGQ